MTVSDLIPTWPIGFDAWEGVLALLVLAVMKLTRATVMKRRATAIDRLGWSILVFDVVFGLVALVAVLRVLYPAIGADLWIGRITTTSLIVVALWQVIEVVTAQPVRIETAMSGPANGYESGSRIGEDRRAPGVPGRRGDDYVVRGLDAGPGQERR
jgi:hypothetical protein